MTKINSRITIRTATQSDWERIIEIYNQAVLEGEKTADTEPVTVKERKDWLSLHLHNRYPILLAELNNQIVGWCSLSPHRPGREALEKTAEISYYILANYRRQGIASTLITASIETAKQNGIKNLFSILLDINKHSVTILEKFGFEKWGHLPNIAELNGKVCGQFIYGKEILEYS
ncbi:MAG: N-acetyltransferase [Ignavibacteriae bacterium]|nr:N-acetyltransferase [Ignavibacteriota bacterium]